MRQASSARGNVARLYFGMDRAIPYTARYPASIGYHPGRNALIAIATDSTGQITGGQFIHLDPSWARITPARTIFPLSSRSG